MIYGQVCVIIKMIKSINLLIQNSRQHKNLMKSLSQHCTNSFTNSKNNVSVDVQWKSKYCNNNWSNQISELWILYSTGVLRINKSEYLTSWKSNLPSRKSVRHLQTTTLIYQKLFIRGNYLTTLQHQICDNNHTNFQCYPLYTENITTNNTLYNT